jgi:hypothetical protein
VADVQPRPDVRGEQAVAGDDRLLGDRRPPGQPQPSGQLALVHLRILGEPRLLRVLGDDAVEGLDVLQRAAHQHGIAHAPAVVGEHPDRGGGVGHRAELGQPLAGQADGDRADRADVAVAGLPAQPPDLLDHAGRVGDGVGVGHRVHGGEAAEGGRPGAGLHRLGVLTARLAQVRVEVDEAREGDEPLGLDDLAATADRARRDLRSDLADRPVAQHDVGRLTAQERDALDQVGGHSSPPTAGSEPPSNR